jgi:hypothetical protein
MKLIYLDTCQPDYFQGFRGTTLIAFHHKGQTVSEMLESLELNANNESHEGDVYEALHNFIKKHKHLGQELAIDEKYIKADEDGDTGLVHYFGVVETEDV